MKIVFASRNEGKIKEISYMLEGMDIELASLNNYANVPEIAEDGKSFLENALKKPKTRRPTKPTRTAVEKRLKHKKSRSLLKQWRRKTEINSFQY